MCNVCFVYLSWVDYSCLEHTIFCWMYVCFCIKFFFIAGFYHFFYVKNPKTHKKEKIQKVWATLLSFVSKYVLSCTFVQMTLCIYEHSLFPMHSYHYGRNFEIYVTVVNRSSTLSWMTSEWFCWSWDLHRLVPIYLPTLSLLLKELTKCKSLNEKRYWTIKACRTY